MKYFLGYYNNREYIPIKDEKTGDTLKQVVDYTTSFTSIKKIKEDLLNRNLIPSSSVRIDYIIEKGTKKNRVYQPLNSTKEIYLYDAKSFFDVAKLKDTLATEIDNTDFIAVLNSKYIKKYGYLNRIIGYIYDLEVKDLVRILEKLQKISLSEETKKDISKIFDYLDRHPYDYNQDILGGLVDGLINTFKRNPYDITNMYIFFKRYITFRSIPAMAYLARWLQIAIDEGKNGNRVYIDPFDDPESKEIVLSSFFNEIVYEFDYTRKEYKYENGKRKINYRELFDLGVYVEEYYRELYNEYVKSDTYQVVTPKTEETDEYDEEEFLEEEDFERIGTTSEEAGYNLRRREW